MSSSSAAVKNLTVLKGIYPSTPTPRFSLSNKCSWPGSTCDWRSGVITLNITVGGELKLGGEIATEIRDLTELRVLSVSFHSLVGEILARVWRLQKLEFLNLEGNLVLVYLPLRFMRSLRV